MAQASAPLAVDGYCNDCRSVVLLAFAASPEEADVSMLQWELVESGTELMVPTMRAMPMRVAPPNKQRIVVQLAPHNH